MATAWYVSSAGWAAVTVWQPNTAVSVGTFCVDSSYPNVFVCIIAGTTGASTPAWQGRSTTYDNGAYWCEITGSAAANGDTFNTPSWAPNILYYAGQIVKNVSGGADTYFYALNYGASASTEPTWDKTPGDETVDSSSAPITWISLGPIAIYATPWAAPSPELMFIDNPARSYDAANGVYAQPGDTFYISSTHIEVDAATTYISMGTYEAPSNYFCVVDNVAPPTTFADTASFTGNALMTVSVALEGFGPVQNYVYGLNFVSDTTVTVTTPGFNINTYGVSIFEKCSFNAIGTTPRPTASYTLGASGVSTTFIDCNLTIDSGAGYIYMNGILKMIGGSISPSSTSGSTPFPLFVVLTNASVLLKYVDLSSMPSSLFLIQPAYFGVEGVYTILMENCKVNTSVPFIEGATSPNGTTLRAFNCDSTATNSTLFTQNFLGTTEQNTSIVRTGGASNGVTPVSWQMDSLTTTTFGLPLQSEQFTLWNTVYGGPIILYVEIASASPLTTDDVWMEVSYPSDNSSPLGTFVNTRGGPTGAPAIATSTATWTGSPGSAQRMVVTISPMTAGAISVRVCLGKPNTTIYVDPYISLTAGAPNRAQYLIPGFGTINETTSSEYSYTFVS